MAQIQVFRPRMVQFVGGPYDGWENDLGGQPVMDGTPWFHNMLRGGKAINAYCVYRLDAKANRMRYEGTRSGRFEDDAEYRERKDGLYQPTPRRKDR